jgi:acetyl esterase/lipase
VHTVDVSRADRAEARQVNAAVEELLAQAPPVREIDPDETRRLRAEGAGPFGPVVRSERAEDRSIPGPTGPVRARTIVPDDPQAVFLHLHGGGWVLGSCDQQDPVLDALADHAHVAVVSIDYRLAPEHPYPAGPDDCEAAAVWLLEHGAAEFGTERLLIGGESAGAHLAAVTLLRLRDRHGAADRFVGANLVFGAYDLSMTPSQRIWGERNLLLSTPILAWFYDCFLPGRDAEARRDPDVSPLYANLQGLPPALFTVGELDPLLDDSLFMAARWRAAGNDARLDVYPDAIHGFPAFGTKLGKHATRRQMEFVRAAAEGRATPD